MKMDMFGLSSSEFGIDDLLNIPNDDVLNSSSSSSYSTDSNPFHNQQLHLPQPLDSSFTHFNTPAAYTHFDLCVPSDDAAELEWLSRFVDDSFTDFPTTQQLAGAPTVSPNDSSFSSRTVRSKRSIAPTCTRANANINTSWSFPAMEPETWMTDKSKLKREPSPSEGTIRRCSHCASEKTPQWRTGPLGPKTLCNACGVRYKSGRLVPEYRPAASPTFVLTQHSNSHRKVMELRRQKEIILRQQPDQLKEEADEQQQEQFYSHLHGFQVS